MKLPYPDYGNDARLFPAREGERYSADAPYEPSSADAPHDADAAWGSLYSLYLPIHPNGNTMNPTREPKTPRVLRRVRNFLAGLFGAALASTATVGHTQSNNIPQPWISYARLASGQFQAWLSDGSSDAVQRLHARLQDRMLKADSSMPPPALIVRVWIGPNGHVDNVVFDTLGDPTADKDLRVILTSQSLSEPPPRDMKQPMVLQLDLDYLS